ncbi:MAG TPA: hypothetical protein VHK69_13720 [Chitinophagaceae bacterium]|jgi:hypothetical protein|nr:hypothetical protein [Chitinophagaceae bacterium]
MLHFIPLRVAVFGTLFILAATIVFHLLVVAGIIPFEIVWGGNLESRAQRYAMETVSIALNVLMLLVILIYARIVPWNGNRKIISGALWLMAALFLLNTLGNLMAKNALETYLFTPITLILSLFCLRIASFGYNQKQTL